jgi:hypothetical protein
MLVVQVWTNCIIVLTICDSFSGWSWCTASKMVKNGVLSVCSSCRRPQPLLYLYVVFSMPWLRCLTIQGWAGVIWSLPTKLVAVWTRILMAFFISNVSWVVANVMICYESFHCFKKCNRKSGSRVWYNGLTKILQILIHLSQPTIKNWWNQWESWQLIIASNDEGDGLTLCEWYLFIRLWPHSFLSC